MSDTNQGNYDGFAYCALPIMSGEQRSIFRFHPDNSGGLVDDQGNRLRIIPFDRSNAYSPQTETLREHHLLAVDKAIMAMRSGSLRKVVLSRIKHVSRRNENNLNALTEELRQQYPKAFVYWLQHPDLGTWIGATPELLISKRGHHFKTVSLAGTLPVAQSYHWDDKLVEEQSLVTTFIIHVLNSQGVSAMSVNNPETYVSGPVAHLMSGIHFTSEKSAEEIAERLHPTPAVGGLPREAAMEFIDSHEVHDRRLYTGVIGIDYANGDADYFVNLRCMQVFSDHFELFLGGGITPASRAESEWEETEHKSRVLQSVIMKIDQ